MSLLLRPLFSLPKTKFGARVARWSAKPGQPATGSTPTKKQPEAAMPAPSANNGGGKSTNYLANLLGERWFRIFLISILVIVGFLLLNLIGERIALLFFTVSPLLIGYGLVMAIQPLQRFLQNYFSLRTAKILASGTFLLIILLFVAGIFILFFFQLESLYNALIKADGDDNIHQLLQKLSGDGDTEIKISNVNSVEFIHNDTSNSDDPHKVTFKLINGEDEDANYSSTDVGGLYTLIFWLSHKVPVFKSLGLNLIRTAYSWGNTGYIERVFLNYAAVTGVVYIIFFSLIIMMFAVFEPPRHFFRRIWGFLVQGQTPKVRSDLEFKLRKKMKGWLRGLLLDQLYVLTGTALVLLLMGLVFNSSTKSKLLENAILLSVIMAAFNLIPYIGPWIGGAFIGGFVLSNVVQADPNQFVSWLPFIFTMLGVIMIQIGESVLVAPIVYSNNVQLSPIAVIMLLLIFGVLFGIWSMPFAIPVLLIAQTVSEVVYSWKWKL